MKLIGKIVEIYKEETYKAHTKRLVKKNNLILKMENNQLAQIQFQGKDMDLLKGFRENQEVVVDCIFRGQYTSKRFYDNIVGKKIVKL